MTTAENSQRDSFWTSLKKEFSCESLSLQHEVPEEFYLAECQGELLVHPYFLFYRIILALVMNHMFLNEIFGSHNTSYRVIGVKWLLYAAHWKTVGTTILYNFSAGICCHKYMEQRKLIFSPHRLCYGAYWFANVSCIDITLSFTVMRHYKSLGFLNEYSMSLHMIFIYVLMPAIVTIDMLIVAHPIRILHVYCPLVVLLTYELFSYIYPTCGGTSTNGKNYADINYDWLNYPVLTAYNCILQCSVIIVMHIIMYFVFRIRRLVSRRLSENEFEEASSESFNV